MPEKVPEATARSGIAAVPHAKGVTFRVWAPHAKKVCLTGTFNGWRETSTPLFNEENGYWSKDVSEAKVGDEYRYMIRSREGDLSPASTPMSERSQTRSATEWSMTPRHSIGERMPLPFCLVE